MAKERAHLNLSDDLDVSEFLPLKKEKTQEIETKTLEKIAEQSGFVSRKHKSQRRRKPQSPYKTQLNVKCREEMKELFQDIGNELEFHDRTTFEQALLAIIEKYELSELLKRYKEIVKES